MRSNVYYTEA